MRFYDPFAAAVHAAPTSAGGAAASLRRAPAAPNRRRGGPAVDGPDQKARAAIVAKQLAAQVASGRRERLQAAARQTSAAAEAHRAALEAESWDFGADPMHWARARYGAPAPQAAPKPRPSRQAPQLDEVFDRQLRKTSQMIAQLFGYARAAA